MDVNYVLYATTAWISYCARYRHLENMLPFSLFIRIIARHKLRFPFKWLRPDLGCLFRLSGQRTPEMGFTMLELVLVLSIIVALLAIGVPTYSGYLRDARDTKAIHDIQVMERLISAYEHSNDSLPESLDEIGDGKQLDPWGNPYEYLPVAQTRKGRQELINTGILENTTLTKKERNALDKRKPRRERFKNLLNIDYDLYSKGPDGLSKPSLNKKVSRDDIVRAVEGGYIGRAIDF